MKPVNLLPESYRPRRSTGGGSGDSRLLIGLLAVLLVMAVAYALSVNQVNSRRGDIASAKAATQKAEAESASQSAFGGFHDMKETRVASVAGLASGRVDWERLMREVAYVLPKGTWILGMTTSSTKDETSAGSSSTPPPSTSSSSSAASGSSSAAGSAGGSSSTGAAASPTAHITGCALHQDDVAVLLVRLRKLHRATDVDLTDSTKEEQTGGDTTSAESTAGSDNCGNRQFKFDVTVTFSPPKPEDLKGDGNVPVSLGGGS